MHLPVVYNMHMMLSNAYAYVEVLDPVYTHTPFSNYT